MEIYTREYIIDKVFLLLFTGSSFFSIGYKPEFVIIFLLAIFISACLSYYIEKKEVSYFIFLIAILLSFWNRELCIFLPLFYYDILRNKPEFDITFAFISITSFGVQNPIFNNLWPTFLVSLFLSYYLKSKTEEKTLLQEKYITLQDTTNENQTILNNQNQILIEKQNNEIELAILNERNRIARDIHDTVGHLISSSLIQIGAIQAINKEEKLQVPLKNLKDTLGEGMNNIRISLHNLHDGSLDFESALKGLVEQFKFCKIELHYEISETVPQPLKLHFLMLVKEGLSNVMKHSNATKVTLIIIEHPGFYKVSLRDNGTLKQGQRDFGIGLKSIQERINQAKGRLTIEQSIDGFHMLIIVPKSREGGGV